LKRSSNIIVLGIVAVGIAAGVVLFLKFHSTPKQSDSTPKAITAQDLIEGQIDFQPTTIVDGTTADGKGGFTSHRYKSSDGVEVSLDSTGYQTHERATTALEERLKDADQIIERKPKMNEKGEIVGERVVAIFSPTSYSRAAVIWTDGSVLSSIESSSLPHALAFEILYLAGKVT
jgi:hypothetical protein